MDANNAGGEARAAVAAVGEALAVANPISRPKPRPAAHASWTPVVGSDGIVVVLACGSLQHKDGTPRLWPSPSTTSRRPNAHTAGAEESQADVTEADARQDEVLCCAVLCCAVLCCAGVCKKHRAIAYLYAYCEDLHWRAQVRVHHPSSRLPAQPA
jgi:hypothetical protein